MGVDFGSHISHQPGTFIYMKIGLIACLLFCKTGTATPEEVEGIYDPEAHKVPSSKTWVLPDRMKAKPSVNGAATSTVPSPGPA